MSSQIARWTYRVYELRLQVNRQIPGLLSEDSNKAAEVSINMLGPRSNDTLPMSAVNLYTSPSYDRSGAPHLQVWRSKATGKSTLYLRYTNGDACAEFHIDAVGSRVCVTWLDETPFDDIVPYLLGPVMGCVLRLRGVTCLHASALAVGDAAIAFIGPKGAGKSTVIAALAERGYAVLTDDIAPLLLSNGKFYVQPGYPRLRLWRTTADRLNGVSFEVLPRILSQSEKRFLDLELDPDQPRWKFHPKPLPLVAIYMLGERVQDTVLSISSPPPGRALFAVTANTYADYVLDRKMRAHDFDRLGRLARHTPIRQVDRPDSLDALPLLCDTILDDLQRIT